MRPPIRKRNALTSPRAGGTGSSGLYSSRHHPILVNIFCRDVEKAILCVDLVSYKWSF